VSVSIEFMTKLRNQAISSLPLLAVIAVFAVYLSTLLPGVGYSGDTGKFQFVGKVLGIPHEPGSPTYVLLNHLFVNVLPIGSIAYRANLLSAVFAGLALSVLARILSLLNVRPAISALVILTFGFTYTLWSQSVIAEVYTLCVLFVTLTLFFFVRWHINGKTSDFLAGCAVYAISFGNHLLVVTLLPSIMFLVWVTRKEYYWSPRIVLPVLLFIVLGAAQYGYLIWRTQAPETSYLEILVPDVHTLWYFVTGGQFQPNFLGAGWKGAMFERVPLLLRFLWLEFLPLTVVSLFGFLVMRQAKVAVFLVLAASGAFLFNTVYIVPDIFIYMLPVYVVVAIGLGTGLEWLAGHWSRRYRVVLGAVVVLIPVIFLFMNFSRADQGRSGEAKEIVEGALREMGSKALLICPNYDYAGYFWYYTFAEKSESDSLFVLYAHDGHLPIRDLEEYLNGRGTVPLPLQRRNAPEGLSLYYCTAYQPRPFDIGRMRYPQNEELLDRYRRSFITVPMERMRADGFIFEPVARELYRILKPQSVRGEINNNRKLE